MNSKEMFLSWLSAKQKNTVSTEVLNQMFAEYEKTLQAESISRGRARGFLYRSNSRRWQTDANGNTHFVS
jgi:hypothetical protein